MATILLASGCGDQAQKPLASTAGNSTTGITVVTAGNTTGNTTGNTAVNKDGLPLHGKLQESAPPAKAVFGMIYRNTADGRDYIYDGSKWVPHDGTVDAFYKKAPSNKVAFAVASLNSLNGGAHDQHGAYGCETCHRVDWANGLGLIWFDNTSSPAFGAGMPAPVFNEATVTCSNIACHSLPSGLTFSYYFPDGTGDPVLHTVNITNNPSATTPNWFSTGAGCSACHGNPPVNGSDGSNVWHSGLHANSIAGANECQFCHPDATGVNQQGTTITNPAAHANGVIDVHATFTSACFSCH